MKDAAVLATACLALAAAPAAQSVEFRYGPPVTASAVSSAKDFDFFEGKWQGHNRRLKVRHAGSNDWDEFPGELAMRRVLGGVGNVDEVHFPTKGWSGVSMRFFNPQTRLWSIYWVNSRDGLMQEPVVGSFNGPVGEFYGDDMDGDRPIFVRYRWTVSNPERPRWEQAFSTDRGKTWETNWICEFTRAK